MKKPNGYDETQVSGNFTPVETGGHYAVIKKLEETTSRAGKPMIKVAIDFTPEDKQPDYFMDLFKADTREERRWPANGVQYILTEDADGKTSRSFKSFITSVEASNGAEVEWGDKFEKWFVGKKVGVVFGEVEEEYNGEVKTRRKIRWFCEYSKAGSAQVPDKKFLAGSVPAKPAQASDQTFVNIPDGIDGEIPF